MVIPLTYAEIIRVDSLTMVSDMRREDSVCSTLSVQCPVEPACVILDTIMIGKAPVINYPLTAGRHIISVQQTESWKWYSPSVAETIFVGQSEHIDRTISFPPMLTIRSDPFGTEIRYNDSLLGETPLQIIPPESGTFQLSKDGYRVLTLPVPVHGTTVTAIMEPLQPPGQNTSSFLRRIPKTPPSFYVTASAAIFSGAAAVYFKISADKLYREYQRTGDGTTLCRVERLDVAAGISFAVSEISIFMLYSLLLSQ